MMLVLPERLFVILRSNIADIANEMNVRGGDLREFCCPPAVDCTTGEPRH